LIESKDISVVVQGAIDKKETPKCLKSIRKYLPGAQIILSTWDNSDTKNLDYDILIENTDPGAVIHDFVFGMYNNTNRQIYSTQEGIKLAKNKYILKLRTDFFLKGNNFLNYWDKFNKSNKEFKCFNHRVIVASVYSREVSDLNSSSLPFHPSDFFFFGEADDVKKYFLKTKLLSNEDLATYPYKYEYKKPYITITMRYSPEQYLCLSFFRQFYNIKFDDLTDWDKENVELSTNLLYNNFIFLGEQESEIFSKKHSISLKNEDKIAGLITYKQFVSKYKKLCDTNFNMKDSYTIKAKFNKHYNIFFRPIKKFLKWLGETFSVGYYGVKILLRIQQ
jgi:hypothetical protein